MGEAPCPGCSRAALHEILLEDNPAGRSPEFAQVRHSKSAPCSWDVPVTAAPREGRPTIAVLNKRLSASRLYLR